MCKNKYIIISTMLKHVGKCQELFKMLNIVQTCLKRLRKTSGPLAMAKAIAMAKTMAMAMAMAEWMDMTMARSMCEICLRQFQTCFKHCQRSPYRHLRKDQMITTHTYIDYICNPKGMDFLHVARTVSISHIRNAHATYN